MTNRRSRLGLEIAVVLAVKFVALALIWLVWFAHPAADRLQPERVGAVVYSSGPAPPIGGADARP